MFERKGPPGEIFRFLYSVDSLQDSLRVKEIDSACRIAFDKEGINVPISILRNSSFTTRKTSTGRHENTKQDHYRLCTSCYL